MFLFRTVCVEGRVLPTPRRGKWFSPTSLAADHRVRGNHPLPSGLRVRRPQSFTITPCRVATLHCQGRAKALLFLMRIVIVTSSSNRSGGTRQALYQARGLAERGHDVTLALPENSSFWELAPDPWWRAGMEALLFRQGVARVPAIVHAFHNRAVKRVALWGLWWRRRGVACVAHRGVLYRPGNPLPYLSPAMRAVIVNSRACAKALRHCTPKRKIHLVANAVPDERITPTLPAEEVRRRLGLGADTPCFVYVGNDSRVKGAEELIRAFAAADLPDVRLIMLGVSPERWRPLGESLGADLVLPGSVENVSDYMQLADAFVFPTNLDSAPNTLLEAIRMGLPVLATAVGGVPEIMDGNGLLVPPGDARALTEALRGMASDPGRRAVWGRRSLALGRKFSVEARCAALETIYESVL